MRGYRFLLWKKYFDTGYGLTNYIFKLIAVLGITAQRFQETVWILIVYSVFCLILGRIWLYSRLLNTEQEISNMFNPFVDDMRKKFKIPEKEKFK